MNGSEQTARHGQVKALEVQMTKALDGAADRLDAADARLTSLENAQIIRDERLDTLKASQDALAIHLGSELLDVKAQAQANLVGRTTVLRAGFFGRLGWLLFGRGV